MNLFGIVIIFPPGSSLFDAPHFIAKVVEEKGDSCRLIAVEMERQMARRPMIPIFVIILACIFLPRTVSAHTGFGIVVDRQGRVVFLDSTRNQVWRIDANGKLTSLAADKHGNTLVPDADGDLFVEHFNASLWKITPEGSVSEVKIPGRKQYGMGSLHELLAVDREGNFYFSGTNDFYSGAPGIVRMTPAGEITTLAGGIIGHADGQGDHARFTDLRAAAWGPDGALYVTDRQSVRRVSLDGTVTTLAGDAAPGFVDGPGQTARFERLLGLAFDPTGSLLVVDTDNFRVRKISPDGHVSTVRQTQRPWKPAGVAVAGDVIYVLELRFIPLPLVQHWFTTHRVRQITPDGTITTLVTVGGGGGILLTGVLGVVVLAAWQWRRRRRRRKAAEQGRTS
jgi:sugar lactone lactonase YvrE